jgi:predicted nucleic acid-binding Zn ribbon protein
MFVFQISGKKWLVTNPSVGGVCAVCMKKTEICGGTTKCGQILHENQKLTTMYTILKYLVGMCNLRLVNCLFS